MVVEKLSCCFELILVARRSVVAGFTAEPVICQGCWHLLAGSARIQVQLSFLICLGSRMLFAKTVTSDLPLLTVLAGGRYFLMSVLFLFIGKAPLKMILGL